MTLTETYNDLLDRFKIPRNSEMVFDFSDKGTNHTYLPFYERYFEPHRAQCSILEIGVMTGGSMRLWSEYFDSVSLTGIDLRVGFNQTLPFQSDIKHPVWHWGVDTTQADQVPDLKQYQFVIDDGLHTLEGQWSTFQNYWRFVCSGGTYFVEDIVDEPAAQELRFRIQAWVGDTVDIEHYRGRVNERADDQILAITRK